MKPKVSVVMPTYNTNKKYLEKSISSILNQTYKDFELIIIDDSSVDDSEFIRKNFNDERIVLLKNEVNLGIAKSLNKGIKKARGKYIARMDSDDIALRKRLETQVNFLEKYDEIDILGSSIITIGSSIKFLSFPKKSIEVKTALLFSCPIVHPTVMFRKSIFTDLGYEYTSNFACEDYHLWVNASLTGNLNSMNLFEPLLLYRKHGSQITKMKRSRIIEGTNLVRLQYLRSINVQLDENETELFFSFCEGLILKNKEELMALISVLDKIRYAMIHNGYESKYVNKIFKQKVNKEFTRYVLKRKYYGVYLLKYWALTKNIYLRSEHKNKEHVAGSLKGYN